MSARSIGRFALVAALAIAAACDAQAKNLAEMAAGILRDVVTGYEPAKADDGKYHIVVLYNTARIADVALRDPDIVARQEKVNLPDVYTQLQRVDEAERRRIQCIIIVDLEPHQVIAAEQFARDRRVVIAAVILPFSQQVDRGSIPFIFDLDQQVGFARSAAVSSYKLQLTTMPPKGVAELEREAKFQNLDQCTALKLEDRNAYPEVICHRNAFDRIDSRERTQWNDGLRDLDVAVLRRFEERYDLRQYPRGWGREGYHPHIGLADYLSKYGNCAGAQRELKLAELPRDAKKKKETEARIATQCSSVRPHIASNSVPTESGWSNLAVGVAAVEEAELFPPLRPALLWSEIAAAR